IRDRTVTGVQTCALPICVTDPQSPRYQGQALSSDGEWIIYNSKNWVWLPSEYRPTCSAVLGKSIGIGVGTGKVWICNFKVDNLRSEERRVGKVYLCEFLM